MTKHHETFEGGRGFLIVFGFFTVLFSGFGVYELADADGAMRSLSRANQWLGGVGFSVTDVPVWRYATAAAMVTLGLMCLMLVVDLRRNYPVLVPAAFFKSFSAVLWFVYFRQVRLPVLLAFGLLDCVFVFTMIAVGRRAHRGLLPASSEPRRALATAESAESLHSPHQLVDESVSVP